MRFERPLRNRFNLARRLLLVSVLVILTLLPARALPVAALIKLGPDEKDAAGVRSLDQLPKTATLGWRPILGGSSVLQPFEAHGFQDGYLAERAAGVFQWFETQPIVSINKKSEYGEAWEQVYRQLLRPNVRSMAKWIQCAEPAIQLIGTFSEEYIMSPDLAAPAGVLNAFGTNAWSPAWSHGATAGWHLDDARTELDKAWKHVRENMGAQLRSARIAIIDTYFDQNNPSTKGIHYDPGGVRTTPNHTGVFGGPAHGTGTLSILAGQEVQVRRTVGGPPESVHGANPDAEIVPIAGASGVAHIFSTASVSEGLGIAANAEVDIVSISMGGWPSTAVRDGANQCYSNGIAVFAASGDYFSWPFIPVTTPSFIVYPAAYDCCDAVVGITAKNRSYVRAPSLFGWLRHCLDWSARGCAGPCWEMDRAVAAYSPNIAWAIKDATTNIRLNGSGTSASTPQAAGAASLWYEKFRNDVDTIAGKERWKKAELILQSTLNHALLPGHDAPNADVDNELGRGVLKARQALKFAPNAATLPAKARYGKPSPNWIAILLSMLYPRETRLVALDNSVIGSNSLQKAQSLLRDSIQNVITTELTRSGQMVTNTGTAASTVTNNVDLVSLTDVFVTALNLETEQKFARTKGAALLVAWYQRASVGPDLPARFSEEFTRSEVRHALRTLTDGDCSPTLRKVVNLAVSKASIR